MYSDCNIVIYIKKKYIYYIILARSYILYSFVRAFALREIFFCESIGPLLLLLLLLYTRTISRVCIAYYNIYIYYIHYTLAYLYTRTRRIVARIRILLYILYVYPLFSDCRRALYTGPLPPTVYFSRIFSGHLRRRRLYIIM